MAICILLLKKSDRNHSAHVCFNAAMTFSYLSELDDHTEDWMVRARVCRRWESINMNDGSLISFDMILVDEKVSALTVLFSAYCGLSRFIHSIHCFGFFRKI